MVLAKRQGQSLGPYPVMPGGTQNKLSVRPASSDTQLWSQGGSSCHDARPAESGWRQPFRIIKQRTWSSSNHRLLSRHRVNRSAPDTSIGIDF